jgi:multidrug efflux pump subunit AcrA (membrane-fusion protein)
MRERTRASWIVYALGALLAGAIVAAVLVVGPASGRQSTQTRVVTARRGVVQSTVSGSGNVAAASQLDLGFRTSGTVSDIAVTQGQHVAQGQLIATLDPQSAEVTLEQANASLRSAEANLAREVETDGESSSQGSSGSTGTSASGSGSPSGSSQSATNATDSASKAASGTASSPSTASISTATREANIASAKAAVRSDRLTVRSDEQAVSDTSLPAPESGTIVSLSGEVGETVSGGGTSKASSTSESSSSGTSSSGASAAAGGTGSGSSSSGSSGASSSSFAVLSDLSSMKLVVPLSESEVGSVKAGQTATVTVEALKGAKLAAHVSEVAALSTSNSGVVSYDVTFVLDQLHSGLKAGMSASAEVVVAQAEGVNVPTSAISGGSLTVVRGGKQERRTVTTGLAGDSSTLILSGLKAGEQVALPVAGTSGTSSLLSRLAGSGAASGGLSGPGGLGGTDGSFARSRAAGGGPGG